MPVAQRALCGIIQNPRKIDTLEEAFHHIECGNQVAVVPLLLRAVFHKQAKQRKGYAAGNHTQGSFPLVQQRKYARRHCGQHRETQHQNAQTIFFHLN